MSLATEILREQSPVFSLLEISEMSPEKIAAIEKVYERAYGDIWIGHDTFTKITLPSTTHIALLEIDGQIVSCGNMSGKRIALSGTDPEFQGKRYKGALMKGISETVDGAWVSINTTSNHVFNIVTASDLPFTPVNDPVTIVNLYRANDPTVEAKNFTFTKIFQPSLSALLTRRGDRQEVFTACSRENAIHSNSYQQVIFQSRKRQ